MRKPNPIAVATEIVHAWIPAAAHAVVVAFAIAVAMMWIAIANAPVMP